MENNVTGDKTFLDGPKVQLKFTVEKNGDFQEKQLPFVIGVIADLSGHKSLSGRMLRERHFVAVDRHNFTAVLKATAPTLNLMVDNCLAATPEKLKVDLTFTSMKSFEPTAIIDAITPLKQRLEKRETWVKLLSVIRESRGIRALINRIAVDSVKLRKLLPQKTPLDCHKELCLPETAVHDEFGHLINQFLVENKSLKGDVESTLLEWIADIDRLLTAQVNAILHCAPFQQMEGTWRGLHKLIFESQTGKYLKIKVLDATKNLLLRDLSRADDVDQSATYKKIYTQAKGKSDGLPFGVILGDFQFSYGHRDVEFLAKMSEVAASVHTPFIASSHPMLLNRDSWTELPHPRDLENIFEDPEHADWRSFRHSEESKYVGLTLPRYLARLPYRAITASTGEFSFEEDVDGKNHDDYVWSNSSFLYGIGLANRFTDIGWPLALKRINGSSPFNTEHYSPTFENLPLHTFKAEDGCLEVKSPTEASISDRRDYELSSLGFLPLVQCIGSGQARFFREASVHKARARPTGDHCPQSPNEDQGTQSIGKLPALFARSRIAHHFQVLYQAKRASFSSVKEFEAYFQSWINTYSQNEGQVSKEFMLFRQAIIRVEKVSWKPNSLRIIALLTSISDTAGLDPARRLIVYLNNA